MKLNHDVLRGRIARARSMCGRQTRYVLGAGGGDPNSLFPIGGASDCTGFISRVCWLRRDQRKKWGLWVESTEMVRDAKGAKKLFVAIPEPVRGCIVAYPDSFVRRLGRLFKTGEGHAAIVESYTIDGKGRVVGLHGVDCSLSSFRKTGDAIASRRLDFMVKKGVYMVLKQDILEP